MIVPAMKKFCGRVVTVWSFHSPFSSCFEIKEDKKENDGKRWLFTTDMIKKNPDSKKSIINESSDKISMDDLQATLKAIKEHAATENTNIFFAEITDEPKGCKQESEIKIFDHEFIDQKIGMFGDDFYGDIYYPLKSKYLKVPYSCW